LQRENLSFQELICGIFFAEKSFKNFCTEKIFQIQLFYHVTVMPSPLADRMHTTNESSPKLMKVLINEHVKFLAKERGSKY